MKEWSDYFAEIDACVTPVLEPHELGEFAQIAERYQGFHPGSVPPVPVYSRTAAAPGRTDTADATERVLTRFGLSADEAGMASGLRDSSAVTGLRWPPM